MEELKSFSFKAFFFYFFKSWRVILTCLVLCAVIAVGVTYAAPPVSEVMNSRGISQREYDALIDSYLKSSKNGQNAKLMRESIREKNAALEYMLSEDLYFQIDPEQRMNKSFVLNFKIFDSLSAEDEARTARQLSLRYLQSLQSEAFATFMQQEGRVQLSVSSVRHLIRTEINEDGLLFVEVTAPSEGLIDAILLDVREYLEGRVHAGLDLMGDHQLRFTDERTEVVQDPGITTLRQDIENMIAVGNESIRAINQEIMRAVDEINHLTPNADPQEAAGISAGTVVRRAVLGLLVGLFISVVWTLIRYWNEIGVFDVQKASNALNLMYLGELPMDTALDPKRRGNALDRGIARGFKKAYDASDADTALRYAAELIVKKVNAMRDVGTLASEQRKDQDGAISDAAGPSAPIQLLVPGTEADRVRTKLVEQLQAAVDKAAPDTVVLKPIGRFAGDPTAVQALKNQTGLLYLWSETDPTEKRMSEYQLVRHLDMPAVGVIDARPMF